MKNNNENFDYLYKNGVENLDFGEVDKAEEFFIQASSLVQNSEQQEKINGALQWFDV